MGGAAVGDVVVVVGKTAILSVSDDGAVVIVIVTPGNGIVSGSGSIASTVGLNDG